MNLQQFAKDIVKAANETGNIRVLPISKRDQQAGCILRFRIGSL